MDALCFTTPNSIVLKKIASVAESVEAVGSSVTNILFLFNKTHLRKNRCLCFTLQFSPSSFTSRTTKDKQKSELSRYKFCPPAHRFKPGDRISFAEGHGIKFVENRCQDEPIPITLFLFPLFSAKLIKNCPNKIFGFIYGSSTPLRML
ncbi:hypothetical protein EUTSA_v10012078mg [Eutrema salsugineum]|uniref:Uncharacterized protein n=1 Tax=Eutrema salsugineum TaxID=72664 RepID=V4JZG3_EUTSA|nr:hypothetical protein EUTSA_v10012078mg [Eutrema salsugineum]